jgi:hypothetical protein
MAKKRVGIEDLLIWAYRDQMVHAARPEGAPAELGRLAGAPKCKASSALFGADGVGEGSRNLGFEAAPDAWRVHAAVLGLGREAFVHPAWRGGLCAPDVARGTVVEIEPLKSYSRAGIVMACALEARRPDWVPAPKTKVVRGAVVYKRQPNGQPARDRSGQSIPLLQVVRFAGDMPWEIDRARVEYRLWLDCLRMLRERLNGRCAAFDLTEILPPVAPWRAAA